ncbi:hypothetical protein SELMODRAFT_438247 [Selaginella moellendorffii]|uniref:Uncharacterized protein n=1 Tax=Selaginella moellendorffii TaxID=88036 RepID=D8QVA3_SELML|nr:hypothetical protein SELMODRAFT_438247 [Selaginella moellendorffii]
MEAGCGSVKAEASVSIAAGCDPMKVDGLVKMEAGFESARVEAPVGSVKMEPGYDTVKVETPFRGGKAAHLSEAKVVPIENDTAKAAEKQPVVLDAESNRFRINVEEQWKESSKVEALLHHLQTLSEAGSKSVDFSQWTAFLDLLEIPLKRKTFCFVRLDGTLSQRQREQVLKNFSNIPAVAPSSESRMWTIEHRSDEERIDQAIHRQKEERVQQVQARKQRLIGGSHRRRGYRYRSYGSFLGFFDSEGAGDRVASGDEQGSSAMTWNPPQVPPSLSASTATTQAEDELGVDVSSPSGDLLLHILNSGGGDEQLRSSSSYRTQQSQLTVPATALLLLEHLEEEEKPADNVVHPPHSSGELKPRPGLHFGSPVFGPSAAETSDSKRAPEQPRRSVTPAKDDKQQFHGNASTKVDATQDSGDSGEPSQKGSPSAVHGPIGPPRRHVVSPPQSPNDLLGRLWAALPSSSHTLFDGESERKTSARSFGVEANEMSREVDGENDKPRTNSASGRLQDYRGRYVNGEAEFEAGGDDFRGAGRRRGTGRADARRGGRGAVGQWIAEWRIKQADSKAAFPAEKKPDYKVAKARSLASQLERPGLPSGSTQNSSVGAAFEESKQRLHNLDALEGEGVTTSLDLEELQIDGHRRQGKAPQFYKPKENRFRESRRVIPMHRRDLLYRLDLQNFTCELFCLYDELIPTGGPEKEVLLEA